MIIKYNNKVVSTNSKWVGYSGEPTPSLPPYTLRLKFKDGVTPSFRRGTGVLVDTEHNIWDLTYENSNWTDLLYQPNLLEIMYGNTTGVTDMYYMLSGCSSLTNVTLFDTSTVIRTRHMFSYCTSLTTVPLFDTSNVLDMQQMFYNCTSLTNVPLFNTTKATVVSNMFQGCINVETGALALYNQMSTQSRPPSSHLQTFRNCGSNTQTGAAELAQIPSDWK